MSALHAEGVWLDSNGNILGYGCSDGDECATCFALVESTAGVAEFVSYDELDTQLDDYLDDTHDTDTGADTRERVR